ncbi:MAG: hypothetical protein AAFR36_32000 [Bacteroidota bacterium]
MIGLLISLASGAVGGNLAGALMKGLNQGTLINSIAGIVGGGVGGQVLSMLGLGGAEGTDLAGILSTVAGGAVGGGGLMAVIGLVKNAMGK